MAKATPSPLLSDISGKIGTSVFARYRGSLIVRTAPVVMTNPNSTAQANVRAAMSAFGTAWAAITSTGRNAWEQFARTQVSLPQIRARITRHNLVKEPMGPQSAYNAFLQLNMNRYLSGGFLITDILTDAPLGLPRPCQISSIAAAVSLNHITVTWDTSVAPAADDRIQIWIRSIDANIHKQLIATDDASTDGPVYITRVRSILGAYVALPIGTYEIQAIIINQYGLRSAPSEILSAIVTATGWHFVSRSASAKDKTIADFTCDSNWHVDGLDLSAIIPTGAKAVLLLGVAVASNAARRGIIRVNATTKSGNRAQYYTTTATIVCNPTHFLLPCENDRLFDYNVHADFTTFSWVVSGWWI